ncbi:NusA-like KH domain protein [uncultured archaeon]|nr:NusA-like KH domain protein [uncultured archaeon]
MQTPICRPCAIGDKLCPACQSKLGSGAMSKLDVDISRILYKINEQHNLSIASFSHALDAGGQVLIFTPGEPGVLIGRGGKVVSALAAALGRRVRIVSESGDQRRSLEDLLSPVKVIGINEAFHAGTAIARIRLAKEDESRLKLDVRSLEPLVSKWMGKKAEFVFE